MLVVQHGDEYGGMEISNMVFDGLNLGEFRGSLISIPVSNRARGLDLSLRAANLASSSQQV